jgi:hypothetical protein
VVSIRPWSPLRERRRRELDPAAAKVIAMDTRDPAGPGLPVIGWLAVRLQGSGGLLDGVAARPRVRADGQVWLSWHGGPTVDAVATALLSVRDPDFPVEPVPSSHFEQARLRVGGVLVVLNTQDLARE